MASTDDDLITKSMPDEMKDKDKWYGDAKDYWKVLILKQIMTSFRGGVV